MTRSEGSTIRIMSAGSTRRIAAGALAVLLSLGVAPAVAGAVPTQAVPAPIPRDSHWLTVVNHYRAIAGLAPVRENPTWSAEARLHSCYMLRNGISHDEVPGAPGYTPEGRMAGLNGNVATTTVEHPPARRPIELWLTGPFHAIGLLRHHWVETGFGQCDRDDTSPWRSAATLDVLRGLDRDLPWRTTPTLFPGHGTTTNLDRFVNETPNPLDFCGWTGGGGLPVIALMPEGFSTASGTMSGPSGALETCVLHPGNTTGVAQQILARDHGVVVMARHPLDPGVHTVNVTTSARQVSWSFTVDPSVADAPLTPVPTTRSIGPRSGFTPLAPVRLVDTRSGLGGTRLSPGTSLVVQVAGQAGAPRNTTAVSVNLTATNAAGSGYVTLHPCSGAAPQVSTVNFVAGATVPNAAFVPLSSKGSLCITASTAVDVLLDVNGAFSPSARGTMTFVDPVRVFDTRTGHRAAGRLADGGTLTVRLRGESTGVATDATAVVMNLTAHRPSKATFVTAWPAGTTRPLASNLNLRAGEVRANLVVVPLGDDGRASFYSEASVDLFADLVGYVSDDRGGLRFTPLSPTRLVDTRSTDHPQLHLGTNGQRVDGGGSLHVPVRGARGVPGGAAGIAANVTTVGATAQGYVTAYPCSLTVPHTSTVNLRPSGAVPNAVALRLSEGGATCVYASDAVHVVVDVTGYWS